jgi:hypothetical protein
MSQTVTAGGIGAVTYGPQGEESEDLCHNLQTISLKTGEPNWDEPVSLVAEGSDAKLDKLGGTSLSISSTVVTAPYAGTRSQAEHSTDLAWFDTKSGERLGATDNGTEPVDETVGCRLTGHAHAAQDGVIAIVTCWDSTPHLMKWDKRNSKWGLTTSLDGCGEVTNVTDSAFMRQGGSDGDLVIGCFKAGYLEVLSQTNDGSLFRPIPLKNIATETIGAGNTTGAMPLNILTDKRDVYLPRGEGGTSNGVVAVTGGYSWEYALRDTSEVRLMGVDQSAVTVMVVTPGPAALYTIKGANEMEEAPELDPKVAEELAGAERSYRVGDYLVCSFNVLNDEHPVIGVVRMVE